MASIVGGSGTRNVGELERVASVVVGSALAAVALRRRGLGGLLLGVASASLLHRGATGHCLVYGQLGLDTSEGMRLEKQHGDAAVLDASKAVKVEHAVTIARPRAELYAFWRDFANLPDVMTHLESVMVLDERRSLWRAKGPAGQDVEWEAEVINEVPDTLIGWRSVEEATVPNAGSVHFTDAVGGGTELRVVLEYMPPAGRLGRLVARLFGEEPAQQVRDDLQRFKETMESAARA